MLNVEQTVRRRVRPGSGNDPVLYTELGSSAAPVPWIHAYRELLSLSLFVFPFLSLSPSLSARIPSTRVANSQLLSVVAGIPPLILVCVCVIHRPSTVEASDFRPKNWKEEHIPLGSVSGIHLWSVPLEPRVCVRVFGPRKSPQLDTWLTCSLGLLRGFEGGESSVIPPLRPSSVLENCSKFGIVFKGPRR